MSRTVNAPAVAADALAAFRVAPARKVQCTAAKGAVKAPVPEISEHAYVTRGARVRDDLPVLFIQDGSVQTAMALCAIGKAISDGVLSRAEIMALLGES